MSELLELISGYNLRFDGGIRWSGRTLGISLPSNFNLIKYLTLKTIPLSVWTQFFSVIDFFEEILLEEIISHQSWMWIYNQCTHIIVKSNYSMNWVEMLSS